MNGWATFTPLRPAASLRRQAMSGGRERRWNADMCKHTNAHTHLHARNYSSNISIMLSYIHHNQKDAALALAARWMDACVFTAREFPNSIFIAKVQQIYYVRLQVKSVDDKTVE